ncbi:Diaminopimelate decarboxylase [hydrothermal vent metagenome]|uniref:diaminopimelate decarboxylase n=1 Tax=hydrothermal vent metagenome TaxID=652676 RepID=A0A3B1AXZ3_9ZZZZ
MDHFEYQNNELFAEQVSVQTIADQFGTPCYVYSRATFERHWRAFDSALAQTPHLICYAVKANSNIGVLNILARLGSGFDIVSVGELERVLKAGGDPAKVVFSGVAKRPDEIQRALEVGIHCFNVESESELYRINEVAKQLDVQAPISLRVNPDVDAQTHPYIATGLKENKFGITIEDAIATYKIAAGLSNIEIRGIDCHIGSQLTSITPFVDALTRVLALLEKLKAEGIEVQHIDIGGGLGIRYQDETPPAPDEYAKALNKLLADYNYSVIMEPGRAIAGNAGILVTRVEHLKHNSDRHFAIIDAAMNDLMRPALYGAWQAIVPVKPHKNAQTHKYDVVGPICETGDFLGKQRELNLLEGDLLAIRSAGAYGFTMSSNYNSRTRAAEVMVDGDSVHLVRKRERIEDLFADEKVLP